MEQLDLDINNYNINDLERFFQINPNAKYTEGDIELKEYSIREKLLSSGHIDKRFKRDLIEFLELAKNWLIFVKCRKGDLAKPTTVPTNYKLDTMDTPVSKEIEPRTNELITHPDTQFVHSSNSEFFPGKLNQLNTRIVTKSLNIDTRFRDNLYGTQSSDFSIQMPIKFNKVVSMNLSSLELPVSFYGICEEFGNNFLYLNVTYISFTDLNVTLNSDKIITIPDGNYNSADLLETVNKLLSPVDQDGALTHPEDIFSYISLFLDITSSGSGTGKVTIRPSGIRSDLVKDIALDFTKDINVSVQVGDTLYFHRGNASTQIGLVQSLTSTRITAANSGNKALQNNDFLFVSKPTNISTSGLTGYYSTVVMTNTSAEKRELFAVNAEAFISSE